MRQNYFDRIYNILEWGGCLFLFEKIRSPDARFQDYSNQIYCSSKKTMDSSQMKLFQEHVFERHLEPFSYEGNVDLLKRAGFSDIECIFKYLCFAGYLCIK